MTVAGADRRRAAISSFGFSGTNAHLVIEEHESSPSRTDAVEPAIVVLSARDPERLRAVVQDLLACLEAQETEPDLASIAFTLQVGRQAMEERLGVVVESVGDLVATLRSWLAGEAGAKVWRGHVARDAQELSFLHADDDAGEMLRSWAAKRKYGQILKFWVRGARFDWTMLHSGTTPRRVPLPTYPFRAAAILDAGRASAIAGTGSRRGDRSIAAAARAALEPDAGRESRRRAKA